jgi:type IV pilus assembly protein PilO
MTLNLRHLRQRDIAIILLVITVVAGVLWYFYMYQPSQDRIASLEANIQRLEVDIRRGEDARRNLPELRLAVALLEEERRVFLSQLPTESQVAALIDSLRYSGDASGVTIRSFSQGTAQSNVNDVRAIGFNVTANGPFSQSMGFIDSLENLQRFTKLNTVGLAAADNESEDPELNTTVGFTIFVFTGADPGDR